VAKVVGESGAWSEIVFGVAVHGHSVSKPEDLAPLLDQLREARPSSIDAHRTMTLAAVQERATRIAQLNAARGLIRSFLNAFRVRDLRSEIASLYAADAGYPASLDRTIIYVEMLLSSPELAGAEAELEVIRELRRLPDPFLVYNDVRLKADRHIFFDGAALQSAQLDHVVLSKWGVFAIETKHWSRRFVETGVFHDPYDQSRRAGYLCFDLLREHFGKVRVQSVIVSAGRLPQPPAGTRVDVVRPEALTDYIVRHRKEQLADPMVGELGRFFERRVGGNLR
jgi:hypothetical protein